MCAHIILETRRSPTAHSTWRDMSNLVPRVFSMPSRRHIEKREDAGDEVAKCHDFTNMPFGDVTKFSGQVAFSSPELRSFWPAPWIESSGRVRKQDVRESRTPAFCAASEIWNNNGYHRLPKWAAIALRLFQHAKRNKTHKKVFKQKHICQ